MARFQQQQLGAFLRARRDELLPREVGLSAGPRRRSPGLRRDEVAMLANMSSDYYERIEQGRGPQPSPSMLGVIARALRLNLAERDHIYVLAGHPAPEANVSLGYADPGLMTVLDALAPSVPALIADDLQNVVGQNALNVALLGQLVGSPGSTPTSCGIGFSTPSTNCSTRQTIVSSWVATMPPSCVRHPLVGPTTRRSLPWSTNSERTAPTSRACGISTK